MMVRVIGAVASDNVQQVSTVLPILSIVFRARCSVIRRLFFETITELSVHIILQAACLALVQIDHMAHTLIK